MPPHSFLLCTLLIITFSYLPFHEITAVQKYIVINEAANHPGGVKFTKVIGGIPYTKKIMGEVNNFIWSTVFKQNTPADRKPVDTVEIFITEQTGWEGVCWGNNKINISAIYLNDYKGPMTLKWEFTSLMYHEMTHVFQWSGEGMFPVGLQEGIADYTVIRAKYNPPGFCKPGSGKNWDQGYDYTARFLEYCDGLVPDFTAKLNNMMRKTYDVSFFQKLTGKPVEQLWNEYKAKYPGN